VSLLTNKAGRLDATKLMLDSLTWLTWTSWRWVRLDLGNILMPKMS